MNKKDKQKLTKAKKDLKRLIALYHAVMDKQDKLNSESKTYDERYGRYEEQLEDIACQEEEHQETIYELEELPKIEEEVIGHYFKINSNEYLHVKEVVNKKLVGTQISIQDDRTLISNEVAYDCNLYGFLTPISKEEFEKVLFKGIKNLKEYADISLGYDNIVDLKTKLSARDKEIKELKKREKELEKEHRKAIDINIKNHKVKQALEDFIDFNTLITKSKRDKLYKEIFEIENKKVNGKRK